MNTVIFSKENFEVRGFATAQVDPVATKEAIKTQVIDSAEFQDMKTESDGLGVISMAHQKAKFDSETVFINAATRLGMSQRDMGFLLHMNPKEALAKLNVDERKEYDDQVVKMKKKIEDADNLMVTVLEKQKKLQEKQVELLRANAIYFTPRYGESILTDEEFDALKTKFADLNDGQSLSLDGGKDGEDKQIIDLVGSVVSPE